MDNLSQVLWRERELLESLVYRLETEHLLLTGGRTRWLGRAAGEVEVVLESIRHTEVLRAVAADEAARELGLPASSTLRALADASPEPWRTILHDHRDACEAATEEVVALAEANRELIADASVAAHEALLALGAEGVRDRAPERAEACANGGR